MTSPTSAPASGASPAHRAPHGGDAPVVHNPWAALGALLLGFFMILVDSTIVSVATETIMTDLNTSMNNTLWVTSGYLLAYAVPLLITGRLGDRFGARNLYLAGLTVFTIASAACGLSSSITALIICRVVQGLGAAMLTPQTMAIITQIFPAERRGQAMGAWGATAGVATLVGPILGGLLVDHAGWQWIFYINVPVGIIGFVLAWRLVPRLPVHAHSFDIVGVVLSAAALFCLVFGVQEGEQYDWGTIKGFVSVPLLIAVGILLFVVFLMWQKIYTKEPLVPLHLFANRNFALANVAITTVGFAITAMSFPLMIYAQTVLDYSPTQAALLLSPMAILSGVLAPVVGHLVDRHHPALLAGIGLALFSLGLFLYAHALGADTSVWQLLLISAVLGLANAFMWSPLSVTATRTLPRRLAGAGSGIYNTTRQLGSVLGSAAIAALMDDRLTNHLGSAAASMGRSAGGELPARVAEPFARAMGESLYLPAAVVIVGVIAALAFTNPHAWAQKKAPAGEPTGAAAAPATATSPASPASEQPREAPVASHASAPVAPVAATRDEGPAVQGTVTRTGGAPVRGAHVTLTDATGAQVALGASGADGAFRLAPVPVGAHLLIVAADGLTPSAHQVSVTDATVRRDVVLAGGAGLTGFVLNAENGPVADALVTLTGVEEQGTLAAHSEPDGSYAFSGLVAGDYVVTAQHGRGAPRAQAVRIAGADTRLDLTVGGGGRLTGLVVDPWEAPVGGASVTVVGEDGDVVGALTTDAQGRYALDALAAGTYTVTAAGHAPVAVGVDVADGQVTYRPIVLGEGAPAQADAPAPTMIEG